MVDEQRSRIEEILVFRDMALEQGADFIVDCMNECLERIQEQTPIDDRPWITSYKEDDINRVVEEFRGEMVFLSRLRSRNRVERSALSQAEWIENISISIEDGRARGWMARDVRTANPEDLEYVDMFYGFVRHLVLIARSAKRGHNWRRHVLSDEQIDERWPLARGRPDPIWVEEWQEWLERSIEEEEEDEV